MKYAASYDWTIRALFYPMTLLLIVLFTCFLPLIEGTKIQKFLRFMGGITFEIYLIHEKVLDIFDIVAGDLINRNSLFMVINQLISMVCAVLLAWALNRLLKIRLIRKYQ
jgi:peptidoglycan/LPS O-acetylase OafA/YrhL